MSKIPPIPRAQIVALLLTAFGLLLASGQATASETRPPSTLASLTAQAPDLNPEVLKLALEAAGCAWNNGERRRDLLTVIDYSLHSMKRRLWVFNMETKTLVYRELVAHGVGSGAGMANKFSNKSGSLQSSLGLFRTGQTYEGKNGYSLKLHGLEEGINHEALPRTIVMHGAWYVNEDFGKKFGRMGRSWGCPALDLKVAKPLIDTIKNGTLLFVYYPDQEWLNSSSFLTRCFNHQSY